MRQDLRSLSKDTADLTAKHLVLTGRLLDEDPEQALAHARAAGALAGRIGMVREAVGLAAYAAGEWAEALSELRAARRITGRADHLPVMADSERALQRPERALAYYEDPDVGKLEQSVRVELAIVVAGARRDMDQADAAVLLLQGPARATTAKRPWAARLWYAYADSLLDAGRTDEARDWFAKAAEHDGQGETDALDRLLELDGVVFEDLAGEDDEDSWSVDSGTAPDGDRSADGDGDRGAVDGGAVDSGAHEVDTDGGSSGEDAAQVAAPVRDSPVDGSAEDADQVAAPLQEPLVGDPVGADQVPAAQQDPLMEPPADEDSVVRRDVEAESLDAEPLEAVHLEAEPAVAEPVRVEPVAVEPVTDPVIRSAAPEPGRVAGVPFVAGAQEEEHVAPRARTAVPGVAFVAAEDADPGQQASLLTTTTTTRTTRTDGSVEALGSCPP